MTLLAWDNSLAVASAPVRAARKTGFEELLAIIAIVILPPTAAAVPPAPGLSPAVPPPHASIPAPIVTHAATHHAILFVIPLSVM